MRHCLVAAGSDGQQCGHAATARARFSVRTPHFIDSLHKPQITQSPLKRVGALDVLVPQQRWHGLRLPEVVLLFHYRRRGGDEIAIGEG